MSTVQTVAMVTGTNPIINIQSFILKLTLTIIDHSNLDY